MTVQKTMSKRQRQELARVLDEDVSLIESLPRVVVDTLIVQLILASRGGAPELAALSRRMRDAVRSGAWWCERLRMLYAPWVDAPLDVTTCAPAAWLAGSARLGSGRAYAALLTRVCRWCASVTVSFGDVFPDLPRYPPHAFSERLNGAILQPVDAELVDDASAVRVRSTRAFLCLQKSLFFRLFPPDEPVHIRVNDLWVDTGITGGERYARVMAGTDVLVPGPDVYDPQRRLWDMHTRDDSIHVRALRNQDNTVLVVVTTDTRVPRDDFLRAWARVFASGGLSFSGVRRFRAPQTGGYLDGNALDACFERTAAPVAITPEFLVASTLVGWSYLDRALAFAWLVTLMYDAAERNRRLRALVQAVDALPPALYAALAQRN